MNMEIQMEPGNRIECDSTRVILAGSSKQESEVLAELRGHPVSRQVQQLKARSVPRPTERDWWEWGMVSQSRCQILEPSEVTASFTLEVL